MKRIFHLIFLILLISISDLYSDRVEFKEITVADGLSQNKVNDIHQSKRGLLWIATDDGLNYYDGYEITKFQSGTNDSCDLRSDYINDISEDSEGNLWLATYGSGITKFNPQELCFKYPIESDDKFEKLTEKIIIKDDIIWAATNGAGLLKYDIKNKRKELIKFNEGVRDKRNHLRCVYKFKNIIFAGTDDGHLIKYDILNSDLTASKIFDYPITDISNIDNDLILSSQGDGVKLYNTNSNIYRPVYYESDNMEYDFLVPADFNKLEDDIFLVTNVNYGIQKVRFSNDSLKLIEMYNSENSNLNFNSFITSFIDREGTYWFGTNGFGLVYFNENINQFKSIRNENKNFKLSFLSVRTIERIDDNLFIGGYGGLNKVNLKNGNVKAYPVNKLEYMSEGWVKYIHNSNIYSIHSDKNDNNILWIGSEGDGLYKLDINKSLFYHYEASDFREKNKIYGKSIFSINDYKNGFILGTSKSIEYFVPKENRVERLIDLKEYIESPSLMIKQIHLSNDILYFMVDKTGLYSYNLKTNQFKDYKDKLTKIDRDLPGTLNSVFKYNNDELWIGTKNNGLIILDLSNDSFRKFDKNNYLANNCVYAAIKDNDGNYWLSTNNGLTKLNLELGNAQNFTSNFFSYNVEFNQAAHYKDSSGNIYFGGVDGVTYFNPETIKKVKYEPNIIITSIATHNEDKITEKPFYDSDTLNISYNDFLVEIKLTTTDLIQSNLINYSYKVVDRDRNFKNIKNDNIVSISQLEPGFHEIILKVQSADNQNESIRKFYINVNAPFWYRSEYIISFIMILVLISVFFYRRRLKLIAKRNRELENLVRAKTADLRESESKYRLLAENIKDIIWVINKDLEIIYSSPSFTEFYGFNPLKSKAKISKILQEKDIEKISALLSKKFSNENKHRSFSFQFKYEKEEKEYLTEVNIGYFINDENEIIGLIGITRDITEKLEAQKAIKEREILFSSLVNNILEPVLITNWEGVILFANNVALEKLNFSNIQLGEVSLYDFLTEKSTKKFHSDILSIKVGHYFAKNEYEINIEGNQYVIEGNGNKILFDNKSAFLFSFRDITERVNLINKLSKAKNKAEIVSAAKSNYLANLTHELKTPINAISGFTDVLYSRIRREEDKNFLNSIKNSSKILINLINDLLYFTKAESKNIKLNLSSSSIDKIVDDIEDLFKLQINEKNLNFIINKDYSKDITQVNVDDSKLKQILINLINNAIKFTDTGNISLNVTISQISSSLVDLTLEIKDTGKGIPKEKLNDIFTAFKQVEDGAELGEGYGLGLAIVKKIVELMNGTITVKSEVNKGTYFKVVLPELKLSISKEKQILDAKDSKSDFVETILMNDDFDKYDKDTLTHVYSILSGSYSKRIEVIKNKYLLKDIIDFSADLKKMADINRVKFLSNYADELSKSAKSIDVETINVLLNNFDNLITHLSKNLR